jgi:ubiquinone/menaquinone biosynthesis C-methylase UbiE
MQSGWLARAYEVWWRPVLFALSTRLGAPSSGEEAREVLRLIGERSGPWLDVSCGPGTLLRHLVEAPGAPEVVGLDLSRAMLERARVAAPRATLVRGDAARLPFEDGSFGAVANLAALDLYADPAGAVREAARVLARGGRWVGSSFIRRGAMSSVALASGVRTPSLDEIAEWTVHAGLGRFGKLLFRGYAIAWADKD